MCPVGQLVDVASHYLVRRQWRHSVLKRISRESVPGLSHQKRTSPDRFGRRIVFFVGPPPGPPTRKPNLEGICRCRCLGRSVRRWIIGDRRLGDRRLAFSPSRIELVKPTDTVARNGGKSEKAGAKNVVISVIRQGRGGHLLHALLRPSALDMDKEEGDSRDRRPTPLRRTAEELPLEET